MAAGGAALATGLSVEDEKFLEALPLDEPKKAAFREIAGKRSVLSKSNYRAKVLTALQLCVCRILGPYFAGPVNEYSESYSGMRQLLSDSVNLFIEIAEGRFVEQPDIKRKVSTLMSKFAGLYRFMSTVLSWLECNINGVQGALVPEDRLIIPDGKKIGPFVAYFSNENGVGRADTFMASREQLTQLFITYHSLIEIYEKNQQEGLKTFREFFYRFSWWAHWKITSDILLDIELHTLFDRSADRLEKFNILCAVLWRWFSNTPKATVWCPSDKMAGQFAKESLYFLYLLCLISGLPLAYLNSDREFAPVAKQCEWKFGHGPGHPSGQEALAAIAAALTRGFDNTRRFLTTPQTAPTMHKPVEYFSDELFRGTDELLKRYAPHFDGWNWITPKPSDLFREQILYGLRSLIQELEKHKPGYKDPTSKSMLAKMIERSKALLAKIKDQPEWAEANTSSETGIREEAHTMLRAFLTEGGRIDKRKNIEDRNVFTIDVTIFHTITSWAPRMGIVLQDHELSHAKSEAELPPLVAPSLEPSAPVVRGRRASIDAPGTPTAGLAFFDVGAGAMELRSRRRRSASPRTPEHRDRRVFPLAPVLNRYLRENPDAHPDKRTLARWLAGLPQREGWTQADFVEVAEYFHNALCKAQKVRPASFGKSIEKAKQDLRGAKPGLALGIKINLLRASLQLAFLDIPPGTPYRTLSDIFGVKVKCEEPSLWTEESMKQFWDTYPPANVSEFVKRCECLFKKEGGIKTREEPASFPSLVALARRFFPDRQALVTAVLGEPPSFLKEEDHAGWRYERAQLFAELNQYAQVIHTAEDVVQLYREVDERYFLSFSALEEMQKRCAEACGVHQAHFLAEVASRILQGEAGASSRTIEDFKRSYCALTRIVERHTLFRCQELKFGDTREHHEAASAENLKRSRALARLVRELDAIEPAFTRKLAEAPEAGADAEAALVKLKSMLSTRLLQFVTGNPFHRGAEEYSMATAQFNAHLASCLASEGAAVAIEHS